MGISSLKFHKMEQDALKDEQGWDGKTSREESEKTSSKNRMAGTKVEEKNPERKNPALKGSQAGGAA